MTKSGVKNIAASLRSRLLNKAREINRPFNELLQYFAIERFLYRLSLSPYAEKFVLKGALMLNVWNGEISRPTMDIDVLGRVENNMEMMISLIKEICLQKVEPDGIIFDPDSIEVEQITKDSIYQGVRVRFRGNLDNARILMQMDIGFGDVVIPPPELIDFPTILTLPPPVLRGYSKESAIAEKLEAMIKLDLLNSRIKDFFDIWFLSQHFVFQGEVLAKAIKETFSQRGTAIVSKSEALDGTFAAIPSKMNQWKKFLRKNRLEIAPQDFTAVTVAIGEFLTPVLKSLELEATFVENWKPKGPWK